MKRSDILWIGILMILTSIVIVPQTRSVFETLTASYPYLMGFIKTAILASLGERLVHRIRKGTYFGDRGIVLKFMVWGILGMIFVIIFKVFASGVAAAQTARLLPFVTSASFFGLLLTAFMTSILMNVFFAPTFMLLHRITDRYIELGKGKINNILHVKFKDVVSHIDFHEFLRFVVLKTIPFFWIPAHTITFMLPENYRVLMAAYLSIVLGILLSLAKPKEVNENK
ncbi:MAG: hypothetical protein KKG64_03530 [Firmicutes bacterium]|nr:hypothetical protein [Bacillota bacterium]